MKNRPRLTKKELLTLNDSERLVQLYRKDPVLACRDLLGIELTWYQRQILRGMWVKKYVMLLMTRGLSKTYLLAIFALLKCMLYPGIKLGIVAPVFRQAEYVFDYIDEMYNNSPFVRAAVTKHSARASFKALLKFHNFSFAEALPIGDGTKVRGRRYTTILVDEAAQMDPMILKLVIHPMMTVKKKGTENQLIYASSAYYAWNHLYNTYLVYKLMENEKPNLYRVYEFDFDDHLMIPVTERPFDLDMDYIMEQKKLMTTAEWEMEYLARFPVEEVGFISAELIEKCTPKHNEGSPIELVGDSNGKYVMGVDAARVAGGDNFVIQIVKLDGGTRRLVNTKIFNGATFHQMAEAIRKKCSQFPIVRINMDASGGGRELKDRLGESWIDPETGKIILPILDIDENLAIDGLKYLKMVNFTKPMVNDLFTKLKASMQHARLVFPINLRKDRNKAIEDIGQNIIKTKQEILLLIAEPKGNYYEFGVPSGFKKDRVTALALANQAADEYLIAEQRTPIARGLAIGFWHEEGETYAYQN